MTIDRLRPSNFRYRLAPCLSCHLIPTIDKPTRVHKNSASLTGNIFVNNPEYVAYSGNIISDVSDHFSQFCLITSAKEKTMNQKKKVRDFSKFSEENFSSKLGCNFLQ